MLRIFLLTILVSVSFTVSALADCTSPAGAESQTRYDFTGHRLYYCDGTSWVQVGGAGDNLGNHIASTVLRSDTNNTDDLGTSAIRWKDGWFAGTVTAGTFAGSGASLTTLNATQLTTGTVPAARLPAYTGDVTKAAGGTALTIAANAVNSAKIVDASIATADIANSAVTNDKIANATIVATTKLSATGTKDNTTFLRGDNTWAAPPAGGGGITAVWSASCNWSAMAGCTTAACPSGYFRTGCSECGPSGTNKCSRKNGGSGTCYLFCAK